MSILNNLLLVLSSIGILTSVILFCISLYSKQEIKNTYLEINKLKSRINKFTKND